ncbi:MerR family transcriptional regulator [Paenibacillus cremeus]|uniref:MerR family transcriptional regulator n=1 Tax=Paenibacillus cremeus TaxID=2163881 RepID=A0A559K458_9BACL|nr:MerR family transcriptional regulator [Paenibacillus cremeus]TVY06870.1 MerR family transcriptional regulator [Paenibacillus cremeus]
MYSIGDIAEITGLTAYTIRYYEKIGVLPSPSRQDGRRIYSEQDLQYVRFIHGLKATGMSLEDIAAFTQDGCLLTRDPAETGIGEMLSKRMAILDGHIRLLEQQILQLEAVKAVAQEKSAFYADLLEKEERERSGSA